MHNGVIIASALLMVMAAVAQPAAVDLRVACRMGQPPFNDAPSLTSTSCDGMFGAVFYRLMARTNLSYSLTMIDQGNLDPLLIVNSTTGKSTFDMIISFHTVTQSRLALYDFSMAVVESDDAVALSPKYRIDARDLGTTLLSKSVFYVFLVIATIGGAMGVVIFVCEFFIPDSYMNSLPLWKRFLWCMEMGLENVLTCGTSEDVSSQIARSIRAVVGVMGMSMLCIFGAVISAQLTNASLQVTDVDVTSGSLQGTKLAVASSTLVPYVQFVIGATPVVQNNINEFAARWYSGNEPDFSGFVAATQVCYFVHNLAGRADDGYTVSQPFVRSGVLELKAFPISSTVPRATYHRLQTALAEMRDDGSIAALQLQFLADVSRGSGSDIPVSATAEVAMRTIIGIVYGSALLLTLCLMLFTIIVKKKSLSDQWEDADDDEEGAKGDAQTIGGTVPPTADAHRHDPSEPPHSFLWRGKHVPLRTAHQREVLTFIFNEIDRSHHQHAPQVSSVEEPVTSDGAAA